MNNLTRNIFYFSLTALLLFACSEKEQSEKPPKAASKPAMTVTEKKQRFLQLLLPATRKVYKQLQAQYQKAKTSIEQGSNRQWLQKLKKQYKAESDEALLAALKPHPISIVLAQAAMESGWATSRIFKQANNVFGVWSFNPNEPRIPAARKRGDKTIYLKKYATIEDSIRDNYKVLATGSAFKEFRALRLKTDNPFELVKKLDKYSEKGEKYGKELAGVIRYNKFDRYDQQSGSS